jgi:dTDP-4-amino-4,6-dideoxygalactose transaminase
VTPVADALAERLVALPCHAGVGRDDVERAALALNG